MRGKQKSDNGLDDAHQLTPVGKHSGRGKGLKKYLQSNAVKAGMAGVLVFLLVLIIAWQLMLGGSSGTKPKGTAASVESNPTQQGPLPPPPAQVPEPTQASQDHTVASANQSDQPGQGNTQSQSAGTQGEAAQAEQPKADSEVPGDAQGAPAGGENAAQSQIPDDVSKWEKADFVRARQENNSKLIEAVAYLGEKSPGSVPVAQQLADLLKKPKPSDSSSSYTSASTNAVPGLIEAIIHALCKNGSQAARQTLIQVLSGKFAVEDDRMAVEAVLKSLFQQPSPENDDILLKVLISPEEFRPSNQQTTSQPSELLTKALELVKQGASENLCIKLARNLVQKGFEPADQIAEFLLQDNPANLSAQLVLYQSEDLSPEAKVKLEQSFLNYSSMAIGLTMGIPTGAEGSTSTMYGSAWGGSTPTGWERTSLGAGMPNTGATPSDTSREKISDFDRGAYLAKLLWGEPLASLMSERLGDVRLLERSAPQIVLASTIPLDSIHAAMFKMLKKRAPVEGPLPLDTAGWSDKVLTDPGVLVLVKSLPRSKAMKTAPISGGGMTPAQPGGYSTRRPPGMDAGGAMAETAQKKMQIESEWLTSLSKMVAAWCNRLEASSQMQKRAARRGQKVIEPQPTRLDEFDFQDSKDIKDVKIIAAYQLNWPEKAPADMGKVKPGTLKIQYFHLQTTGMLKKTMATFKRQAKGGDIHDMGNGQWLELLKNGSQPNSKRSLDILITSADKQPVILTMSKEEAIDLDVNILAIEIADPSKE